MSAGRERLRAAMGEGRLDLLEYDNRIAAAYSAVTYADLDKLFVDVPAHHRAGGRSVDEAGSGWRCRASRWPAGRLP